MICQYKIAAFGCLSLLVSACGGGGGGGTSVAPSSAVDTPAANQTAQGVFKDSNVAGLKYVSGALSGVTDAQGRFTYEVGEQVTFLLGGVELGSSLGAEVITPIDLVENGTLNSQEVKNIVKLLLLVDQDERPGNGINIEQSLQNLSLDWPPIDLAVADLSSQLASIQSDLSSLYGGVRSLVNDTVVDQHFGGTLSCLYSGAFVGTRDGAPFAFTLDPSSRLISGFSKYIGGVVNFASSSPVVFANKPEFNVNTIANLASISLSLGIDAEFRTPNEVLGTWDDGLFNGSFSAQRIAAPGNIQHRISGFINGARQGVFELHMNGQKAASGVFYDIASDVSHTLEGVLSGDTLNLTASNGLTFSLLVDSDLGAVSGSWATADQSQTGSVSGSGCVTEQTVVEDFCPLLEEGVALRVNHGSAKSFIEQYLNNNPLSVSLSGALGGIFGTDILVNLGQVDALFGEARVTSGQKLVMSSEAFSASSAFSINTGLGGSLSANAQLSLTPNTDLEMDYTCSDNKITIVGPFSVSGLANTSVSTLAGNINLAVGIVASGSTNAEYLLQTSPTGGLWLTN